MNTRLSSVELRPHELADSAVAKLYLECLDAEKRLRGARKMAAAALYETRDKHLSQLWDRLGELDAQLCSELRAGVLDWHEIAVKLRGGE
ncbi:MAG: hypothetical protein WCA85_35410 [Paraburkholderia sp.]|uniref:hypothetical protein n=1 Tax=Paraburkholderia sp. TaxID=1926495 RepID=UPI003C479F9C